MPRSKTPTVSLKEAKAGVSDAVGAEFAVRNCTCTELRLENAMYIVIMARYPLPLATQHAPFLKPVPHTVQDDDFVPESSFPDDRCHACSGTPKSRHLV